MMDQPSYFRIYEFHTSLVNFIIPIYSQSTTIYNFVESFLTTYSTESSDFGHYEIHSDEEYSYHWHLLFDYIT